MDTNTIFNQLELTLVNRYSCAATFGGLNLGVNESIEIGEIVSKVNEDSVEVVKYQTGEENQIGSVFIESMTLTRNEGDNLELEVNISKLGHSTGYGAKSLTRRIKLTASFTDNVLDACFSPLDNAVQAACESLGGTLNGTDCEQTALHEATCATKVLTNQKFGIAGDIPGGRSYIRCESGLYITASGGKGGCAECRGGGERAGWDGEDAFFGGLNHEGGAGRSRDHGYNGSLGAGGAGGGDRRHDGGQGGTGAVKVDYISATISDIPLVVETPDTTPETTTTTTPATFTPPPGRRPIEEDGTEPPRFE